jgi:hypothetical protein
MGADVTVSATYTFRAGRFVSVFLKFPSKDYERVAEIFSERYGEPTTRTTDSLSWIGTKAMVSLHRYRPSVPGEGFATLATADEVKESARLRREQTSLAQTAKSSNRCSSETRQRSQKIKPAPTLRDLAGRVHRSARTEPR